MSKTTLSDSELAEKWAANQRTIRRWRKDGAPFEDEAAMLAWLSTRRSIPPGTLRIVETRRAEAAARPKGPTTLPTGAGAALGRLERSEAAAFDEFRHTLESGDLIRAKACRQTWLALAEGLRKFDAQLGESRREAGDMVPRTETERILRAVGNGAMRGMNAVINALNDAHLNHGQALPNLNGEAVEKSWLLALASAGANDAPGCFIPRWALDALMEASSRYDAAAYAEVEELWRALAELTVADATEAIRERTAARIPIKALPAGESQPEATH